MSKPEKTLSQALAAYASVTSGEALDASLVRTRVLRSVRTPRRRSLRRYSLALPLAATLAASAAFAASQPSVRAAVSARLETWFGAAPAAPQAQPRAHHNAKPVPSATVPIFPREEREPASAPIAINELPLAESRPVADTAEPSLEPAPERGPRELDPQVEAYRAAHRTHFDAGSPGAALAAWDLYLAEFPAGSFATDARFNRALCLVRLGRQAEASAALEPFASAPPGSYRQAEASALLHGLAGPRPRKSE